jgi:hypothetical protein
VLRRIWFPLRLARSRLATGGQRLALVAVGIVAGSAVLAAVVAGRLVMQDRSLELALHQLPSNERTLQVVWGGGVDAFPGLNKVAARQIEAATGEQPVAAMLFREASIQGRLVNVRAADDLNSYVNLVSGRLPTVCVPTHCEVLRLEGAGPIPATKNLNLIEVGRATLKPDAPFAGFVLPAPPTEMVARAVRYHTPQPSPVVIANGVAALSRTPELESFYRAYGWFLPIENGEVHPWSVGGFQHDVDRLTATLGSGQFQVTAPTDTVTAAVAASNVAARRLLLLGGEGAALLIAFTVLAAAALRRDVADARRRLTWFGARRWQVELFTAGEAAAVAIGATALGWIVGGAVAAAIASAAGSPPGDVIDHSLLWTGGLLAGLGVAVAAGLLLYLTVRAPGVQLGRLAITPLDMAALAAIAIVLVGWARGSVGSEQLTGGGGTSAFLLLVPGLIVFAATVVAARVLAPLLRALGRAGRRGPVALRLAAASLARNPGHAAIAATFLVASLGLALFAVAYRSTLQRGQHQEASYAVPADYVLTEDLEQLVPVLHGAQDLKTVPTQIDRLSGNVASSATFSFLALPASTLATIGGWRSDFSSKPRAQLASALSPSPAALHTLTLPPGRQFSLPVTGSGDDIGIRAFFRSDLGDYIAVALGHTVAGKQVVLHGRIPFVHATLAQLRFDILNNGRLTANAGVGIQPSAKGSVVLGTPSVDGKPIANAFSSWLGRNGVSGTAKKLGYILTPDEEDVFRPHQPTDGAALPVLVTPDIAADAGPHGVLPLSVEGETIAARVVGVVQRFPSIVGSAVVADLGQAETRLDTLSPGLGITDELWLNSAQPPSTPELTVASRAATLTRLTDDPLARGALITLAGTAAVALLLALVGLVLSVVGDVRDERGELFDLEAQGASPATIRTHLRLRAALVASFGIVGGIALGAILSALVVSLVSVTAGAAEPEPPLQLSLDLPLLGLAAVVYIAAAVLLVGAATTLRGRAPSRASEVTA